MTYSEALDAALCFGWIDGQKATWDERYWLQRFTPRKPRSKWSKVNKDRASALMASGRMRDAGLRQIQQAQTDGRWEHAYEPQSARNVPTDLLEELSKDPQALAFFNNLDGRNRYAITYRIQDAKRPETRSRRVAKFVEMLAEHKQIYP